MIGPAGRAAAAILLACGLLSPVAAQAQPVPTTCGASDLLAEMRAKRPDDFARVRAAADAVPHGESLLWRIEKPGRAASHLFGTMHSTDPRLDRHVARVRPLIVSSRTIAVEVAELVTPGLREKAAQDIARAGLARMGNAMEGLWPPANRVAVEAVLAERGISADRAQRFETWFLIVALSSPPCERRRRELGLATVDEKIGMAAVKAGRSPVGLETLDDQVAVLKGIGGLNPGATLISIARSQKQVADMRETMTRAYLGGRVGELAALSRLEAVLAGQPATLGHDSFSRALLDDRNAVMRDRMLPLIEAGGAFIAVGALHLPGERGLIRKLIDAGYRVTPLSMARRNGK